MICNAGIGYLIVQLRQLYLTIFVFVKPEAWTSVLEVRFNASHVIYIKEFCGSKVSREVQK